ncbi:MAG: D-mannonate epimerase, partial [Clostridia bacterium]|nr:D-mannonate epimerase [Clostridia bacterium]
PDNQPRIHGLFIGGERRGFEKAVELAQQKNLICVDKPFTKVVVNMDPGEFKTTWLANKSVYRTRMAIADGGELIVLAPGVHKFGEDDTIDKLIRKYGYTGREHIIELCKTQEDLKGNMSAAAHLIHGSSDGRFKITYCTRLLTEQEVRGAGFEYVPYDEMVKIYDPEVLKDGYHTINGEEIFYISNPALGLWADKSKF